MKTQQRLPIAFTAILLALLMALPDDSEAARRRAASSYDEGGEEEDAGYSRRLRRRRRIDAADAPFLVALGGGVMKPFGAIGAPITLGYGATLLMQHNRIVEGFGVEAKGSFLYLPDRKYASAHIMMAPVMLSPMYSFDLGNIAVLQIKAGGGFVWMQSRITGMGGLVKSASSAIDPLAGAGVGIHFPFAGHALVGIDIGYYCIFETKPAHGVQAMLYAGALF